mgnify:CR=1 FL=1
MPAVIQHPPTLLFLYLAPTLAAATACAGLQEPAEPTPQDAARAAFESAEQTYESGNYLEAMRDLQQVKTRHPYSAFAPRAELMVGDCHFEMGKYLEAVEVYRAFVRFHPHHDKVGYARFRIGESYFREMPENWFFMPPAYEKDQAATRDAVRALRRFLDKHPDSDRAPQAKDMLRASRRRLADHEMYVANFYLSREKPSAAAGRLERLIERYPDVGLGPDALLKLGQLYRDHLGAPGKAQEAFNKLIREFPDDERAALAKQALQGLPSSPAPPATAPEPNDPSTPNAGSSPHSES